MIILKNIYEDLKKLSSYQTKSFNEKLIPNINSDLILGVKIPEIRKYLKTLSDDEAFIFMNVLPHNSLEENILHMLLIGKKSKIIEELFTKLDIFVPYIISWSDCDIFRTKLFEKVNTKEQVFVRDKLLSYVSSDNAYTCRFGIVTLLNYFLDENYQSEDLQKICNIDFSKFKDDYYVKMAVAWYISFGIIKRYAEFIKVLENSSLDVWIHNKAIQKATESFRISEERKNYLRTLRRKQ